MHMMLTFLFVHVIMSVPGLTLNTLAIISKLYARAQHTPAKKKQRVHNV